MRYCASERWVLFTREYGSRTEQRTFAGLAWTAKTKVTRRERFLADMSDERRDSLG